MRFGSGLQRFQSIMAGRAMAEKSSSHHSGQEAESKYLHWLAFSLFTFYSIWAPAYGIALSTFRMDVSLLS
jgi:hypothetical protein